MKEIAVEASASGKCAIEELPIGSYTIQVVSADAKSEIVAAPFSVTVTAGQTITKTFSVTRIINDDQIRFVLRWGDEESGAPSDLDSHLVGPRVKGIGNFHTYYSDKTYEEYDDEDGYVKYADLDVDDVSEYMLKPVTAMELREVIGKMKEKVDLQRKEKKKIESLTKTSQDYHKNALVIRSKAIESLVSCTRDVQESLEELSGMGINLEAASYRVALFDMDLFSDIHQIDMEKRQESALMAFVLFNVADEIVTDRNAGIAYQEGNNRVCILFMGNRSREFSREIQEICQEIQKKVKEVIGIEASAGIGGWVRNPGDTIQSHNQAEKAIELRYLLGGNLLIDTETLNPERSISLQQPLSDMVDGIKKGNEAEMNQALSVMKSEIKKARVDKSQACVCLQMILRHAGSCWEALSSENEDLFHKREILMGRVTEQKTFKEAFKMAEDYVHEVFERCSSLNSSSGQKQAVLAMEYIRQHYNEPELGLNDICSYLNIGTSYFSTIFKEATGGTFLEFLSKTRMEKAKELLEQTALKNYEIAEKVGFSDPHYFGISFKKMTGKTPTEYAREKRSI